VRNGGGGDEEEERHTGDWIGKWGVEGRKSANLRIWARVMRIGKKNEKN